MVKGSSEVGHESETVGHILEWSGILPQGNLDDGRDSCVAAVGLARSHCV